MSGFEPFFCELQEKRGSEVIRDCKEECHLIQDHDMVTLLRDIVDLLRFGK